MYKHEEWDKENSLTSPEDRTTTRENPWRPDTSIPILTNEETKDAVASLSNTTFVNKFRRRETQYSDPPIFNQQIGLISFTPAQGATPNKNGVYGFAKLRGNFASDIEANDKAEFLIRNVDSYHQIYHTYVGRPFPITSSSNFSAEVNEIDLKKEMTSSISSDVKNKKYAEKKEIEEIQEREKRLLDESKNAQENKEVYDTYDNYVTLKVKKAQLVWTYSEHKKKMEEIKHIIVKTRKEIEELDKENPEYKDQYFKKYTDARERAGFKDTAENMNDNFIKYMVEDISFSELDELYNSTYLLN